MRVDPQREVAPQGEKWGAWAQGRRLELLCGWGKEAEVEGAEVGRSG